METTLKRTTTTVTEENVKRYLNSLNELKENLDRDTRFSMQSFTKEYNISKDLPKVLKKGKIIRNLKVGKYPEWEWLSIKPNRMMAIKTLHELEKLRKSSKQVKATSKNTKANKRANVKVNNTSVQPEPKAKRKYTKKKIVEGYQVSFFFGLFKINIKPIYKTK